MKNISESDSMDLPAVGAGALLMWLSSYFVLDVFPIPITLQTCAVQVIAFFLTPRIAFLSVGLWIFLGVLGFPCFALGQSGIEHVFGLRGGYIWGFLCAAPMISFLHQVFSTYVRGPSWFHFALSSFLGHIVILFAGWFFVFCRVGFYNAWHLAAKPFLLLPVTKTIPFAVLFCFLRSVYAVVFPNKTCDIS